MSILEYIAQHYMETTKMGQEEISLFDMRKKLFQELKKSEDDEEMDKFDYAIGEYGFSFFLQGLKYGIKLMSEVIGGED